MALSIEHSDVLSFAAHLRLKNLSQRTVGEYLWVLKDFFRFCPPDLVAPQDISFEHLRQYIASLQARKLAAKTVCDRVIILKRFFGYLLAEGRVESDPAQRLPVPKVGKHLPKALTLGEIQALVSAIETDSSQGRRDRVLFELMYAGGLRVSEGVGLQVRDIDFADGSVRIIGKGDKERRVYLKPRLMQLLRDHIESSHCQAMSFPAATRMHYRLVPFRSASNDTPRSRTSIALLLLTRCAIPLRCIAFRGGAPINFVQGLLGHASLATTGKYLLLTDQMSKDIALRTETAPDRLRQTREKKPAYRLVRGFEWDEYVQVVMEWLSDQ